MMSSDLSVHGTEGTPPRSMHGFGTVLEYMQSAVPGMLNAPASAKENRHTGSGLVVAGFGDF